MAESKKPNHRLHDVMQVLVPFMSLIFYLMMLAWPYLGWFEFIKVFNLTREVTVLLF